MSYRNSFEMKLLALSSNESFARSAVAAFCAQINPTLEEINDIKTAVSEAVTNCIVHGYQNKSNEYIYIKVDILETIVTIIITDEGEGISDIEQAMQPFFTTKPEQERSGMGFTVMQTFMDELTVVPNDKGKGVTVKMIKVIGHTE